jgi:CAAX protease family protein
LQNAQRLIARPDAVQLIDVTSYIFVYPLLVGGFSVVWLLSRTKYAPVTVPPRRPALPELVCLAGSALALPAGLWIIYLHVSAPFWDFVGQHGFPVLITTVFLILPTILFVFFSKAGFSSVRLVTPSWPFSLATGGSVSLIILLATAIAAPEFLGKLLSGSVVFFFATAFIAFGEELFYRGLLQTRLESSLGPKVGLILTAGFFGLSHLPGQLLVFRASPLTATAYAFLDLPFFLILGYIAQKSDNLFGSTLVHICYNLPILLLSSYGSYY